MDKIKQWIKNNILVSFVVALIVLSAAGGWITNMFLPNKEKITFLEDKKVKEQLKKKEVEFQKYKDSINRENKKIEEEILKMTEDKNQSEVSKQKALGKLDVYIDKISKGKRENDSLKAAIKDVDSLKANYDSLKEYIKEQDIQTSSIIRGFGRIIINKDQEIEEKERLYTTMRAGYESAYSNYMSLQNNYNKLKKKDQKKFNVGIGAGVGIGKDLQPTPVIAITLNKTLIRF